MSETTSTPNVEAVAAIVRDVAFELYACTIVADGDRTDAGGAPLTAGRTLRLQGEQACQLSVAWPADPELLACADAAESKHNASLAVGDAMGELLNVVAGQIKSQQAWTHAIGLPEAVAAEQVARPHVGDGLWLRNVHSNARMWLAWRADA